MQGQPSQNSIEFSFDEDDDYKKLVGVQTNDTRRQSRLVQQKV